MNEVLIYEKLENSAVRCAVCNHRCTIHEGRKGICGVRENKQGKLYALNYGKTIAMNVDPIEKKPLYHFMPGTRTYSMASAGCNFHCLWCQNWQISQVGGRSCVDEKAAEDVSPEEHVQRAVSLGCPSISYTYSEPTMFVEYALDIMKLAKKRGLKNIWVTNGYMTRETLNLIAPFLDAANVDFKGPQQGVYEKYCGGKAEYVMETMKSLYLEEIHDEVTTLIIPGVNDKYEQLKDIAEFIVEELDEFVPWHISRFHPSWKMMDTPITPIETLKMAEEIGKKAGLKYIHMGNVY